jgi:amino acid transporter
LTTNDAARPIVRDGTEGPQLRHGALTLFDDVVVGVASTAPAYSLTATVAILIGAVGLFSPSAMVLAFLPMLGVAVGFYWLNRSIPNCGTSYAWIARAMNPALGFFTGWVIFVADVIVMISLAGVAAASTLTLFGQDAGNKTWNLILGVAWIAVMTWIVVRGVRLSARLQWVSTVVMGVVSGLAYVISLYASGGIGQAIQNAILAIGLQIAFYYGLTGIAATWYYRRLLFRSASNFIFAGIFPLAGGLGFFYIFIQAARGLTPAQFWTGVGAMLIGIPLLAWSWFHNPAFYRQPTETATDPAASSRVSTA